MTQTMTTLPGVTDSSQAKPGMAFYAGTGPLNSTCGGCKHRGYLRQSQAGHWVAGAMRYKSYRVRSCAMFKKLSGLHGPPVENEYPACKYYEPK